MGRQKDGSLHFDNKHVDNLSDELDDVADQYESLDGGKWDKAYTRAWKKALKTKQAQSVLRRTLRSPICQTWIVPMMRKNSKNLQAPSKLKSQKKDERKLMANSINSRLVKKNS